MATSADAGLSLASVAAYKTARDRERELRHANTKLFTSFTSSASEASIEEQWGVEERRAMLLPRVAPAKKVARDRG